MGGLPVAARPARLQIRRTGSHNAWDKQLDEVHSPACFSLQRPSRSIKADGRQRAAALRQLRRAAAELVGGGRAARGRAARCAGGARAGGLREAALEAGGGQRRKVLVLLELELDGADLPLELICRGVQVGARGGGLLAGRLARVCTQGAWLYTRGFF